MRAFGANRALREIANLVLIMVRGPCDSSEGKGEGLLALHLPSLRLTACLSAAPRAPTCPDLLSLQPSQGNRTVIDGMAPGSAKVLESVLKLVDAYDLYGR